MLGAGDRAPSFTLPDFETGAAHSDPWTDGPVVVAFFKTTCPVCKQAAPKVQALADAGVRVVAIGEDPPHALGRYAKEQHQHVPTLSEPAPYPVSDAFGVTTVPSLFLVDGDGVVADSVMSWDREGWNRLAARVGVAELSSSSDGLPAFRPG